MFIDFNKLFNIHTDTNIMSEVNSRIYIYQNSIYILFSRQRFDCSLLISIMHHEYLIIFLYIYNIHIKYIYIYN